MDWQPIIDGLLWILQLPLFLSEAIGQQFNAPIIIQWILNIGAYVLSGAIVLRMAKR